MLHLTSDGHSLLTALLTCKQTLCFAETAFEQFCYWSERLISWRQIHQCPKMNTGMIWLLLLEDYVTCLWLRNENNSFEGAILIFTLYRFQPVRRLLNIKLPLQPVLFRFNLHRFAEVLTFFTTHRKLSYNILINPALYRFSNLFFPRSPS